MNHSHLKDTFWHTAIYASGIVLSRLIAFVMIPIYTRLLTPADYGILEILSMTTDVMSMLTGLGLAAAVTRYYYHYDDPRQRLEVVSSAVIAFVLMFGLVTVLLLPFADFLSGLLLSTTEHQNLVALALLAFFTISLLEIPIVCMRTKQMSTHVVVVGVVRLGLSLALNLLFVVYLRLGVRGVLYSTIITSGLVGLCLTVATLREVGLRLRVTIVYDMMRYGLPLVAWSLGSFVIHYSDRYFLRAYATLADVGVYSLAYRFAMLLPFFVAAPFAQIWGAKILEIDKSDGVATPAIFREILTYYNVALVTCALLISLFSRDVIRLVAGAAFHSAAGPIPLLCLGMVFFCYRQISQIGATIRFRSDLIGLSTGLAAIFVTLLNFIVIPVWGIMGAAAATTLAFMCEYVLMDRLSRRVYGPIYRVRDVLRPLVLAGFVFAVVVLVLPPNVPLVLAVPAKLAAFGVYVALVLFAGGLSETQRRTFIQVIRDPVCAVRRLTEARRGGAAASLASSPVSREPSSSHS